MPRCSGLTPILGVEGSGQLARTSLAVGGGGGGGGGAGAAAPTPPGPPSPVFPLPVVSLPLSPAPAASPPGVADPTGPHVPGSRGFVCPFTHPGPAPSIFSGVVARYSGLYGGVISCIGELQFGSVS